MLDLNFALGTKLVGAPLYLAASYGAHLKRALEARALADIDPRRGVSGSKFVGSLDQRSRFRVVDGIAIVAVQGILIDRGAWLGDLGGFATSYEGLSAQIARIADDAAVEAIILDIDSPGGMVAGLYDLTAELSKLRKTKPVYALAANMAASAAYAIACVAKEVYVTRTGEAGSIGVIQIHQSYGRMLDSVGIDTTIICEPAQKADGNPFNSLSHGARAEMAASIADAYQMFVAHVVKHRGVTGDAVKGTKARMFSGNQAVAAGLADGVKSIHELIAHVKANRRQKSVPGNATSSAPVPKKKNQATSATVQQYPPLHTFGNFYVHAAERLQKFNSGK